MKVILKQDYEQLGKTGEVVEVKNGYARNFLIPQNIAAPANKRNMKILEEELKMVDRRKNKERVQAEKFAEELGKVSITAAVKVGEDERLFGSVTSQMISDLLKEKGYDVDKKKIDLEEPVKALGVYTVNIKLYHDINAKVRLWVVKE
ncbi:50S ribosomal protein L9 [candidate division KSB1 bacterium]|nr:MAG: 50S ribosomal protein L9 [candidate division KSB1 bacterium]